MTSSKELKIVLVGESKVGKTCIISQYCLGKFDPNTPSSLTATFIRKEIKLPDGNSIIIDIWDTAGAQKYRSLARIFFKEAKAVVIVYDPTNEKTFEEIKNFWYNQVKDTKAVLSVVANKCDLAEKKIKDEEGKAYAESIGAIFASISAKDNTGIEALFQNIAEAINNKK